MEPENVGSDNFVERSISRHAAKMHNRAASLTQRRQRCRIGQIGLREGDVRRQGIGKRDNIGEPKRPAAARQRAREVPAQRAIRLSALIKL